MGSCPGRHLAEGGMGHSGKKQMGMVTFVQSVFYCFSIVRLHITSNAICTSRDIMSPFGSINSAGARALILVCHVVWLPFGSTRQGGGQGRVDLRSAPLEAYSRESGGIYEVVHL